MKRFIYVCLLLSIFFCAIEAQAANWFVRPNGGSYGTSNGTDWNNAFNGFSGISWASVSCGDTIWVAGGTYTQNLVPTKSCTAGNIQSIKHARADATEVTGAVGYSAAFNSTVVQTNVGIQFSVPANYVTISGRTTAAGGTSGWTITDLRVDQTPVEFFGTISNNHITLEYIDIFGGTGINTYGSNGSRGIDDTPENAAGQESISSFHTFSHVNIQGFCTPIYINGVSNVVFEYGSLYDVQPADAGAATCHPQLIYIGDALNGVIRYSRFYNAIGEGLAWSDAHAWGTWEVYGNVLYDLTNALEVQDGPLSILVYNNTFDNNSIANMRLSSASCSGAARNNIYSRSGGTVACGTQSNNLSTSSSSIFVNRATHDYRIVSTIGTGVARDIGTNLGSPYYNVDTYGVTRGADGLWDVGAYEFGSGGSGADIVPPGAPVNLRIQ